MKLLTLILACLSADPTVPQSGMVIEESIKFTPGTYHLASGDDGAIVVRGDNIAVDFTGVTFVGSKPGDMPDHFKGTAVRIDGGINVTIKGMRARGYKVGILARGTRALTIESCDLSYNWRQRLKSTPEREDESDWMSFHHNEKDEWLRYGAGIYLSDCDNAKVTRCTLAGGQCGLMMTLCDGGEFWNNNFSFNSGIGIGMYRSSGNKVQHNKLDWNVRGYSHGVYHRGQDSAAILVYEQSCKNEFAYNSATHSGDGFFLWAGQSTMDTGLAGCNDNIISRNNFSFAPTNGIEVTFSRNSIANNIINGCDHGIWGGYSYDSTIIGNRFEANRIGIAIEHGQNNRLIANEFSNGRMGIRLWMNPKQDPNWGYPKARDTQSRTYWIDGNLFREIELPIDLTDTSEVAVERNGFGSVLNPVVSHGKCIDLKVGENNKQGFVPDEGWAPMLHPAPMKDQINAQLPEEQPKGRQYIIIDEWGPYDFKSPKLWPRERLGDGRQRFEILGPAGSWKVIGKQGVATLSAESGKVPGEIIVALDPGKVVNVDLQLEYIGDETVSTFGVRTEAGKPVAFGYKTFAAPIAWDVKWFKWDESSDPRTNLDAFHKITTGEPLASEKTTQLAYGWSGVPKKEVPANRFATVADGSVEVPDGNYILETTSDDGVRCWVDDKLVIDNWTWHVPTTDTATVELKGKHRIRIEHFEIDGYSTLKFNLKPRKD